MTVRNSWIVFFILLAFILFWIDMAVGTVRIPFSGMLKILFSNPEETNVSRSIRSGLPAKAE
jgi:hypothetical protein